MSTKEDGEGEFNLVRQSAFELGRAEGEEEGHDECARLLGDAFGYALMRFGERGLIENLCKQMLGNDRRGVGYIFESALRESAA